MLAQFVGELTAGLASEILGVSLRWGASAAHGGRATCWVEYFPGGNDYDGASLSAQALEIALAASAEAVSVDAVAIPVTAKRVQKLNESASRYRIDDHSHFLISAARMRQLPILPTGAPACWQFGWGSRSEIFWQAASNADGFAGFMVQKNKSLTKHLMRQLGLPTPPWRMLGADPLEAAREVGWPCVVKPGDRGGGKGITTNIRSDEELERAIALARSFSSKVIAEAHEPGDDYRLTVIDYQLVSAVRREPPFVIGDGRSSVRDLIVALNKPRLGPLRKVGYLVPIRDDTALQDMLASKRLSLDSVLEKGVRLVLRSAANRSTGGHAVDVTDQIHPQTRMMAEVLAKAVSLRAVGIDYITKDITRPHHEVGGGFIEINTTPGLTVIAAAGRSEEEVGSYVLGSRPDRIPVTLLVCGQDGLEQASQAFRQSITDAEGAAAASAGWAQIGAFQLPAAAEEPMTLVYQMLRHRAVGALTIIWTPEMIYEFGVPVDRLEKVVIWEAELHDEWLSLLRRICPHILFAQGKSEAIKAAGVSC
jgi:cyanophycin synthetase